MVRQISRPPLTIDEKRSFWTTTVVELSVLYHARNIVYDVLLYIGNVLILKQKSYVHVYQLLKSDRGEYDLFFFIIFFK